jgi:hypothetical protein
VPSLRRASSERLTGIAWHPNARPTIHLQQGADAAAASSGTVALGTGCADGSAALWSEGGKLLRKLEGHTERCGRVAFHPMGMQFVRCCSSWHLTGLWPCHDVVVQQCLGTAVTGLAAACWKSQVLQMPGRLRLHLVRADCADTVRCHLRLSCRPLPVTT